MAERKVLIIDDDPGLRKTLSDILRIKGYETLTASNGGEGIALLAQGPVDIVIIDLGLPDMPGINVLEKVKAASPSAEAIILTGNATLDSAIEATNRGAFSYLLKPYDIDQLLLQMSRATDKQRTWERTIKQSAEIQRVNLELKALYEVSMSLIGTLDMETLFPEILRKITDISIFSVKRKGCVFLEDCGGLHLATHVGMRPDAIVRCSRLKPRECLCGLAAATGEIAVSKNSSLDERHTIRYEGMTPHGHIVVPLKAAGRAVGVLCLYIAPDLEIDTRILQLLSTLGNQIGTSIMNAKLYEEVKSSSLHDSLTGLGNRRLMDIMLPKSLARARRFRKNLSVIMLDIDHFKTFNDTYGHVEGDKKLIGVARMIADKTREGDLAVRYGGEEFLVVLHETDLDGASVLAEILRKTAEEKLGITVSLGVASFSKDIKKEEELIALADKALYSAKRKGRNRVEARSGDRDIDDGIRQLNAAGGER